MYRIAVFGYGYSIVLRSVSFTALIITVLIFSYWFIFIFFAQSWLQPQIDISIEGFLPFFFGACFSLDSV